MKASSVTSAHQAVFYLGQGQCTEELERGLCSSSREAPEALQALLGAFVEVAGAPRTCSQTWTLTLCFVILINAQVTGSDED